MKSNAKKGYLIKLQTLISFLQREHYLEAAALVWKREIGDFLENSLNQQNRATHYTTRHATMTSKAEVLKRYLGGGGDDKGEGKKHKKLRKEKKMASTYSGLKVVDGEAEEWGSRGGNVEGGDDAPVVVDASDLGAGYDGVMQTRGSWAEVEKPQTSAPAGRSGADSDSDPEPPRRRRHDSSSDSDSAPPRKQQQQPDGHRSDSDAEPPRRPSARSSDLEPLHPPPILTASGHVPGLQTGESFRQHEARVRSEKEAALSRVKPELAGKDAETTYRDRKGRKLDMLNEFMRQQAVAQGKEVQLERARVEWGKGTVQKQSAESAARELEILADEPFARTVDDPRTEALRKQELREGDPMAEYFANKRRAEEEAGAGAGTGAGGQPRQRKPIYKGPAPPLNRFNILPGYRWDGNDRGSGWEGRLLKALNDRKSLKSDGQAYLMQEM